MPLRSQQYNPNECYTQAHFEDRLQDISPDLYESYERYVKTPYEARIMELKYEADVYKNENEACEGEIEDYRSELQSTYDTLDEFRDSIILQNTVSADKVSRVLSKVLKSVDSVL